MDFFIQSFLIFHVNAFFAILDFLLGNFHFLFVLIAIGYLAWTELQGVAKDHVQATRRII